MAVPEYGGTTPHVGAESRHYFLAKLCNFLEKLCNEQKEKIDPYTRSSAAHCN